MKRFIFRFALWYASRLPTVFTRSPREYRILQKRNGFDRGFNTVFDLFTVSPMDFAFSKTPSGMSPVGRRM